tara:strand:- start:959 stop:2467 length:1509 start_codon:yes stop_codon:yes gene_type:complete
MAALIEVKYYNSFILRKTLDSTGVAAWNGSRGNNTYPKTAVADDKNWAVEESRIRGGYNNVQSGYGVKAYIVDDNPNASTRVNALIYSGIFNARTGTNNTNVFSVGEDITKSVDPINGSIQKIYAEDTQLLIFQEKKVSRAPIDKDLIYSAEGSTTLASSNTVIGTINPYTGNFGISKNPESFAVYANRKYFTDKDRNAVLRLSNDGLTEISNYGMIDFFRDEFGLLDGGKLIGGYDIYNKQYSLSIQPSSNKPQSLKPYKTLSFDEAINGWTSFYSYKPASVISLKSNFYSAGPSLSSDDGLTPEESNGPNTAGLYQHYMALQPRCRFYGSDFKASVEFIFNPSVSASKVFKTINYEGSNGWQIDSFISDSTGISFPITAIDNYRTVNTNDSTTLIYSYNESSYDSIGNTFANLSTTPITQNTTSLVPPLFHSGFTRKENKYMANLINDSVAAPGEIIFGNIMTGIKGYFATVKISTDTLTDPGGVKELFAVSSDYVSSAY